jgi:hypothetical protein
MIDFFHLGSNDAATQKPPRRPTQPPPHYRREQLLTGWEWVSQTARQRQRRHPAKQNEDATGRRNDEETERRGTKGEQGGGGEANEERAQETSFDVFWAVGKFFFSFLISLFYY